MGAEENAASQKSPSHHCPAARDMDPLLVKHRGVDHHLWILQQWIQTIADYLCFSPSAQPGIQEQR
jgi:hypothetical protein